MIVTVCIPTYNGAAYLRQAIDSVLSQGYGDFELVIIDNHSTDDTVAIVHSYADPRIRFLQNSTNLGLQANWNRCLDEARGRYVKLLPADDVLAPDCLARQVAALESDESLALAFCARTIIDSAGKAIMVRGYPGAFEGIMAADDILRRCVRRGTNLLGEPGGVLFRRALARQVGGFDASVPYVTDFDYWCRLLAHGDAWYTPDALVSFRVSRQSWSVAIGAGQGRDYRRFVARMIDAGAIQASAFDRLLGAAMSGLNGMLRQALYSLVLK